MFNAAKVFAATTAVAFVMGGGVATPPITNNSFDVFADDILGDYVAGVDEDTKEMVDQYTEEIDSYVQETVEIVNNFVANPNPDDFADSIEKSAEDFADIMEEIGDSFGNVQEDKGDAFGEKFDDQTAEAVVNVVYNILKRFH